MLFAFLLCLPLVHASVPTSLYDFDLKYLQGGKISWSALINNRIFLIANIASECGFTHPGYDQMNRLDSVYRDKGLVILGVPCNQFGGQEPGTPDQIASFARSEMQSEIVLLEKMEVNGPKQHPLYRFLKSSVEDPSCIDSGDESTSCKTWAAIGECDQNPGFMHKSCQKSCGCPVLWNFEYFLVGRDGKVMRRYRTGTDVTSNEVTADIDTALSVSHDEL